MKDKSAASPTSWITMGIIVMAIAILTYWYFSSKQQAVVDMPVDVEQQIEVEPLPTLPEQQDNIAQETVEPFQPPEPEPEPEVDTTLPPEEPQKPMLPSLDESDSWIKDKLPTLTWRKELLKLLVDDDIIRRLVVFTDNFAQGIIAYEHSLLVKPNTGFTAREVQQNDQLVLKWNETSSRRFNLYVDLLRSLDSETLVAWYFQLKPLIDEAYQELGYPDDDFTYVLQQAITNVLDMNIPDSSLELVRPSVMYKYKDPQIEGLDDTEKFMLRLGKENLLVIKSVLLELNEKLSRGQS